MTESDEKTAEFIKNNPYWVLGYIEFLENEVNRVRAAVGPDVPLTTRLVNHPNFHAKPTSEDI
jgi:hypothetical protein